MAQWSLGWTTSGTGDGVSGGYTMAKFTEMLEAWWADDLTDEGVFNNYQNELAVSASGGSASPVTIATGAALVKGFHYVNDAAGTKNIPTPAGSTRVDRIVLEADWSAQTVRFARVAGTEGAGAPSLTQTDNTTWQIPLAQVSITTGGVATVTDQRVYLHPNVEVEAAMIQADAVGSAAVGSAAIARSHLANNSVSTVKIQASAVTAAKIANRSRKLFVPASSGENSAGEYRPPGGGGVFLREATGTGGDRRAAGWGVVPNDYASGFSAVAMIYSTSAEAAGSASLALTGYYLTPPTGAEHAGTNAATTVFDVDGVGSIEAGPVTFAGITAGDVFRLYLRRDSDDGDDSCTQNLYCRGFVVSYTADS